MARRQDGQHRREGLAFVVGQRQRVIDSRRDGGGQPLQDALALCPSGTDLMADCIMFSAQPKAKASRMSRTAASPWPAASAKAVG